MIGPHPISFAVEAGCSNRAPAQPVTQYTSRQILAAERRVLDDAERLANAGGYTLSPSTIDAVAQKYTLDAEDRTALEHAAGHGGFAMITASLPLSPVVENIQFTTAIAPRM
jgi:hypothetical protein